MCVCVRASQCMRAQHNVLVAVLSEKGSESVLLALEEVALVASPQLALSSHPQGAGPLALAHLPVALVLGAVDVNVDAESISLVIFPLTLVDVAIRVPELASAVSLVLAPLTFVFGTIRP